MENFVTTIGSVGRQFSQSSYSAAPSRYYDQSFAASGGYGGGCGCCGGYGGGGGFDLTTLATIAALGAVAVYLATQVMAGGGRNLKKRGKYLYTNHIL